MTEYQNAAAAMATVIVLQSVATVMGLSCYKCSVRPPVDPRQTPRICNKFNYSSAFIVECPYSSFCMKKTSTIELNDKNVIITLRDCAPQKEMRTVEKDGRMQWEPSIVEAYEEGCTFSEGSENHKVNNAQTCYCRNNLCNGQAKTDSNMNSDVMAVIVAYNAIKYVRSFD